LRHEHRFFVLKLRTSPMHFETVHRDRTWRLDTQTNPVALDRDYLDMNVVANNDLLAYLSGQN